LKIGIHCDVFDKGCQRWLKATILKFDEANNKHLIHYHGWDDKWNEWISVDSPLVAPFKSHTLDADTSETSIRKQHLEDKQFLKTIKSGCQVDLFEYESQKWIPAQVVKISGKGQVCVRYRKNDIDSVNNENDSSKVDVWMTPSTSKIARPNTKVDAALLRADLPDKNSVQAATSPIITPTNLKSPTITTPSQPYSPIKLRNLDQLEADFTNEDSSSHSHAAIVQIHSPFKSHGSNFPSFTTSKCPTLTDVKPKAILSPQGQADIEYANAMVIDQLRAQLLRMEQAMNDYSAGFDAERKRWQLEKEQLLQDLEQERTKQISTGNTISHNVPIITPLPTLDSAATTTPADNKNISHATAILPALKTPPLSLSTTVPTPTANKTPMNRKERRAQLQRLDEQQTGQGNVAKAPVVAPSSPNPMSKSPAILNSSHEIVNIHRTSDKYAAAGAISSSATPAVLATPTVPEWPGTPAQDKTHSHSHTHSYSGPSHFSSYNNAADVDFNIDATSLL
jgi:hypothetical protein